MRLQATYSTSIMPDNVGVLVWSTPEKGENFHRLISEVSHVTFASQARYQGTWLPPHWHWGCNCNRCTLQTSSPLPRKLGSGELVCKVYLVQFQLKYTQQIDLSSPESVKFSPFSGELHLEFLVTPKFWVLLRIRSYWAKHSELTPILGAPRLGHQLCFWMVEKSCLGAEISPNEDVCKTLCLQEKKKEEKKWSKIIGDIIQLSIFGFNLI